MTEQNEFAFRKICQELKLNVDEVETDHIRTKIGDNHYSYYTRTGKVHKVGSKFFTVPPEGIEAFIRAAYEPIRATAEAAREKIKANIVSFRNKPHTALRTPVDVTPKEQPLVDKIEYVTPTPSSYDAEEISTITKDEPQMYKEEILSSVPAKTKPRKTKKDETTNKTTETSSENTGSSIQ